LASFVHGEDYQIVDIGMRMLTARALQRPFFPADYRIDIMVPRTIRGKTVTKMITRPCELGFKEAAAENAGQKRLTLTEPFRSNDPNQGIKYSRTT
jgi:hypothetical protein